MADMTMTQDQNSMLESIAPGAPALAFLGEQSPIPATPIEEAAQSGTGDEAVRDEEITAPVESAEVDETLFINLAHRPVYIGGAGRISGTDLWLSNLTNKRVGRNQKQDVIAGFIRVDIKKMSRNESLIEMVKAEDGPEVVFIANSYGEASTLLSLKLEGRVVVPHFLPDGRTKVLFRVVKGQAATENPENIPEVHSVEFNETTFVNLSHKDITVDNVGVIPGTQGYIWTTTDKMIGDVQEMEALGNGTVVGVKEVTLNIPFIKDVLKKHDGENTVFITGSYADLSTLLKAVKSLKGKVVKSVNQGGKTVFTTATLED